MKIVIAIDSFKGSLTSTEAGNAAAAGILRAVPDAETAVFPVADGGEGTTAALTEGLHGTYRTVSVHDPLGRPIRAQYGILPDRTAVMEMSAAAGLPLLTAAERDPMHTTTRGFGEMIADALAQGCREFILGIGGSATNDCGAGCLEALGFRFLNAEGAPVQAGNAGLAAVQSIDLSGNLPALRESRIRVACDVTNPLYGSQGCTYIFAPQKGADASQLPEMDAAIRHFAETVRRYLPDADAASAGAGAAGGMGFALRSFLHADLTNGIRLIAEQISLTAAIRESDLVITGEGCLDAQTAMGKAPAGIAAIAKQYGKPVIAFSGIIRHDAALHECGIDACFPILQSCCTSAEAMQPDTANRSLAQTAEQVFRVIRALHPGGYYADRTLIK